MNNLGNLDKKFIWHPFTPMRFWLDNDPLVIERGEGVYLIDTKGNRYIDGVSSLWCNVHGHGHEHINQAIRNQLEKIAHSTLLGLASPPSIELAQKLVGIAPQGLTKVFYSDCGAAAVEIAIKMALQYWRNLGAKNKIRFVALKQSYHGDTIGSVSIGGISLFHQIFGPLTFKAIFTDSPHPYRFDGTAKECRDYCLMQMKKVLIEHRKEVAAIVVEPLVQGAAGLIVHPEGFLKGVEELARNNDVLLIVDEVATGFGKTGTMFACEQEKVQPDIMCVAKGLAGGYLPVAATLAGPRIFEAFLREPWVETTFYHGHTFTGNALGCAAAIASLEVFEKEKTLENLPPKIALIEKYLKEISELDFVGNCRSRGVMAGIELVENIKSKKNFDYNCRVGAHLCQAMRNRGVILRPLGDVIVIMPPLSISLPELQVLFELVQDGIQKDLPAVLARCKHNQP